MFGLLMKFLRLWVRRWERVGVGSMIVSLIELISIFGVLRWSWWVGELDELMVKIMMICGR